jgi:ribokinase
MANRAEARDLDVVGVGGMVVDRMHRAVSLVGDDGKEFLRPFDNGAFVALHPGGVTLNHLGWAAALGLRCGILGRQGEDEEGRFLRATMDAREIAWDIDVVIGASSAVAEIFVDDAGSRAIYMAPGTTGELTAEQVRDRHGPFIARAERLTTEVSMLPLSACVEALRIANEHGVETWVDLDVPPSVALPSLGTRDELEAILHRARVLKPSKVAVAELLGVAAGTPASELASAARAQFENEAVVVTDGERGCAIDAIGFVGSVPAQRADVTDTTGAGDAFLGGLLAGRAAGLDWLRCGELANAAGAFCAGQLGAFPVDPSGAREAILSRCAPHAGPLRTRLRGLASASG